MQAKVKTCAPPITIKKSAGGREGVTGGGLLKAEDISGGGWRLIASAACRG
jgi:hypothetical protein